MSGVSIATVSRVLNGSSKVSEKTKQKVMAVMEEESYTPNIFARGLGLDSMKTVGIMCPDIADDYMSKAVSCLEKRLHKYGYGCILGCSGFSQEEREDCTKLMLSKRIDTLVMVGSIYCGSGDNPDEVAYIKEAAKKTPVFMINGHMECENVYCACADDYHAMYELTNSLIRRGKERILFMYNSESFSARQKMAGYEAALIEAGYPVRGELKFPTKNEIRYTRDLLLQYKNLTFDAVIAVEDEMAIGALKYARVKGIKIPEELSVAGYNDSSLAKCCEPELTSVNSKIELLCNLTVDRMLDMLKNNNEIEASVQVPCEIKKRCTTDF